MRISVYIKNNRRYEGKPIASGKYAADYPIIPRVGDRVMIQDSEAIVDSVLIYPDGQGFSQVADIHCSVGYGSEL